MFGGRGTAADLPAYVTTTFTEDLKKKLVIQYKAMRNSYCITYHLQINAD